MFISKEFLGDFSVAESFLGKDLLQGCPSMWASRGVGCVRTIA